MGVNIGQAAKASGLSERMIRYFEKQGLIPAPTRSGGGYRFYSDDDVKRMRTIALAQDVGFPTTVIAQLVAMMDQAKAERANPGAEAEAMAELDRKTEALFELRGRIGAMVDGSRSRLLDEEPDIDRGPPLPARVAERPRGIAIVTVRRCESPRPDRTVPAAEHERERERDLTPAG